MMVEDNGAHHLSMAPFGKDINQGLIEGINFGEALRFLE